MKQSKPRSGAKPRVETADYGNRSSYNGIAVVGIVMLVVVLLCLAALVFYFYGGSPLKPGT